MDRPGPTSNKKRSPKERKTPATSPGMPQEPRKELSR